MPLLRILIIIFPLLLQSQAWVKLSDFPGSIRDDGIALVINNKAYVGTGADPAGFTGDFKVFDLLTQQWSDLPGGPLPEARQYACGFKTDTCFFVTCGQGVSGELNSTFRYSLAQQKWTALSAKPGGGLMSAVCFQFNSKIILAGGKGTNDRINHEVWEYDLTTDTWQKKNNLPFSPLWRSAAAVLNGSGYLLGGIDSSSRFSPRLYRYQPALDQWTLTDSLPVARGRAYHALQSINNRLFVFGGFDSLNTYYNDAFSYDPMQMVWHPLPAMSSAPRKGGMSFGSAQNFYYTCGILSNGVRLNETWMTDVPTSIFKNKIEKDIIVYPHPISEHFTIRSETSKLKQISLYSLQGALLMTFPLEITPLNISVPEFGKGLYLLKIETQEGQCLWRRIEIVGHGNNALNSK